MLYRAFRRWLYPVVFACLIVYTVAALACPFVVACGLLPRELTPGECATLFAVLAVGELSRWALRQPRVAAYIAGVPVAELHPDR